MKNCGCLNSCGCAEDIYSSKPACSSDYPECDSLECAEAFPGKCVVYTGDAIANLNIAKGMSFNDIVQKLVLVATNPGCNYPNSLGQSVVGFYSKKITQTTVNLIWAAVTGASYQVQYREPSAVNWTANPSVSVLKDTIGGLTPNTTYYVKVVSTLNSVSCSSVTLEITTLPN